jgi:sodium-dependent dicarboxylate transporter 2/3/5
MGLRSSNTAPLSQYGNFKFFGLFLGPLLFLLILLSPAPAGISNEGWRVVACAALMICWWITEAIPIPATSLLPVVLFPFLDIFSIKEATDPYSNPEVFLYMGGFMLAIAMERWKLHMRIALNIVKLTGTNANGIVAGFMIATAVLSMWMSNTATVVMMLPICLSVVDLLLKDHHSLKPEDQGYRNFAICMMLGIAYAASIGGIATIIGTPTNVIFVGFMKQTYGYEVDFFKWMLFGIPFAAILLFFNWLILVKFLYPSKLGNLKGSETIIREELKQLGSMSSPEIKVGLIFTITAFLWIFRTVINNSLNIEALTDHSIAVISALLLFIVPANLKKGEFLLDWKNAEKLPWGILLLFGGGMTLASGFEKTGLVTWIGNLISNLDHIGVLSLTIIVTIATVFFTEFMSNMALVAIFLPVACTIAIGFGVNPLLVGIPVTISASCAFMLPMSTPPNAIVFASGYVRIPQMIRAGVILNIIGIIVLIALSYALIPTIFNVSLNTLPDWAIGIK